MIHDLLNRNNGLATARPFKEFRKDLAKEVSSMFYPGPFFYYVVSLHNLDIVYCSESISRFHNVSAQTVTTEDLLNLVHPASVNDVLLSEEIKIDFFSKQLQLGNVFDYKYSETMLFKHKDGDYRVFLRQGFALSLGEDGKLEDVLHFHFDISHLAKEVKRNISFLSRSGKKSFLNIPIKKGSIIELSNNVFTSKELEVIRYFADGLTARAVAEKLNISEATVKKHRENLLSKSGFSNTTALVAYCIRNGIIH